MFCAALAAIILASPMADEPATVQNGKAPKGKTYTLKLTETLRVGPDDDENFIWAGSNVAVEADARGHMFVTDGTENRIVEVDDSGKFIRQIGSTGEGPGEFQALISFHFLADGTAIAFDNFQTSTSFSYYDKNLKFVDRKKLAGTSLIVQAAEFSPNGSQIAANTVIRDGKAQKLRYKYSILDKEYQEKLLAYERVEAPFDNPRAGDAEYWAEYLGARFRILGRGELAFMTFDKEGNLYTAVGDKYEVTKWSPDLKKILTFTRDYQPIHRSEEEIQALVEPVHENILGKLPPRIQNILTPNVIQKAVTLAEMPPVKYPIFEIASYGDKLLVIHDFNWQNGDATADIFSSDGNWIGSFSHGRHGLFSGLIVRMIFKNGNAYCIETKDEDNYLVRYKAELKPAS